MRRFKHKHTHDELFECLHLAALNVPLTVARSGPATDNSSYLQRYIGMVVVVAGKPKGRIVAKAKLMNDAI